MSILDQVVGFGFGYFIRFFVLSARILVPYFSLDRVVIDVE